MPATVSRTPAFESYPFCFADDEADAAAFRRARETPFIKQRQLTMILISCN